jgi:hypothetical protein
VTRYQASFELAPTDDRVNGDADGKAAPPGAPPRVSIPEAMRRHWLIALLPVVLLVGAAVAVSLTRPPTYTATAQLAVGRLAVTDVAALPGVVEAQQSVASAYSRAIDSTSVARPLARRFRTTPDAVASRVSATPIPDSPLVRVQGRAGSERGAVALANAASVQLIDYTRGITRANPDATAILQRFRAAALLQQRRQSAQDDAQRNYDADPSPGNKRALTRAQVAAQTAQLRADALRATYRDLQRGGTVSPGLESFSVATSASSDLRAKLQLLVLVGLLAGLAAGAGLATLRANRRTRSAA